jgi:hypothetical protein
MAETILKAFEQPDEVREFPLGRFEIVHVAGVTFGRATYQPGWRWSEHNAPTVGTRLCHAPHTGVVLSGHGVVAYEDGQGAPSGAQRYAVQTFHGCYAQNCSFSEFPSFH